MHTIAPFLWYDGTAEEAATLYVSLVARSRIVEIRRSRGAAPGSGPVAAVTFELAGQPYIAMNGGPHFTFTPAISLFVQCDAQDEIDALWEGLGSGGRIQRCGWLQDRYGVSWQVVPRILGTMLRDADAARADRVMRAMMGMVKLDVAGLQRAYEGGET